MKLEQCSKCHYPIIQSSLTLAKFTYAEDHMYISYNNLKYCKNCMLKVRDFLVGINTKETSETIGEG